MSEAKLQTSAHISPTVLDAGSIAERRNLRAAYDEHALAELADSIRAHGILQPILVRPVNGAFELVCGHRRFRAARLAGLDQIPVVVRELGDQEVLEIQVIENLQREGLHALDEAEGYSLLMRKHGYDAARIAERLGRSVKYVYDRVKLLGLAKEARALFLEDKITAGHAIILARLKPEDQKRCIGEAEEDGVMDGGGLFQHERTLFDPTDEDGGPDPQKAVSVRELQAWVNTNVRFHADEDADPMLFPQTVEELTAAKEQAEKIVPITCEHQVPPQAREGRTYNCRSWKRADGLHKSKPCDRSVTGVIVIGPGRGEAFKVCIAKDKCDVHWGTERREKAKRAKGAADGGSAESRHKKEQERRAAERARDEVQDKRWKKALPTILDAVAAAIKRAPTSAGGFLAKLVLEECTHYGIKTADAARELDAGATAEDVVRLAAYLLLRGEASGYGSHHSFPKVAKGLGIDVKAILDDAAPEAKAETGPTAPKKKAAKRKKRGK